MSTLPDISDVASIILGSDFRSLQGGVRLADIHPLAERRVHEAEGSAARALALSLAGKTKGLTFWIATDGKARSLRARAIRPFLDPAHFVCVEVANRRESLWAAEEALRCRGAGLVVLQSDTGPNLFESRRLQIAAQAGGPIGLIIIERRVQSSAAQTRWQCEPTLEPEQDWQWALTKNKQGRLDSWGVRGDPDPTLTLPPDLLPLNTTPRPAHDHLTLTTLPRSVVSAAAAEPLAPA